jgi:subtilisin family serine protease
VPAGNFGVDAGFDEEGDPIPATGSILVGATKYGADPAVIERGISNWGPRVIVSAPGANSSDVTCCICGNDSYRNNFGGTSGAAAKVAGAMALVLQAFPYLTHDEIVDVLTTRMSPIPVSTGKTIGTFLDVSELINQVTLM